MLAKVVLIDEELVGARRIRRHDSCAPVEARDQLEHPRVLDRVRSIAAPGERRVIRDQHRRHFFRRDRVRLNVSTITRPVFFS